MLCYTWMRWEKCRYYYYSVRYDVYFKTVYRYIFQRKVTRWWHPCFSFQAMFTIKKTIWFREGFEVLILTVKTTCTGLRFLSISHSIKAKEWKFEFSIFDFIEQLIDKNSGACVKTSYQCLINVLNFQVFIM